LRRLRHLVRLRRFRIDGTLGTGDPALTGQVVGFATALRGVGGRAFRIDVSPDFEQTTVRGKLSAEWGVSLLRIWSAGAFVGWKMYRRWRHARRDAQADGTGDALPIAA